MTAPVVPRIHIVGAGRAGSTLASAWVDAKLADIGVVMNRSDASANDAVKLIGAGSPVSRWLPSYQQQIEQYPNQPHWLMLALSDSALSLMASKLAAYLTENNKPELVFHISGQLGTQVLAPLAEQGIAVAAGHPVLAFAQPGVARQQLHNSYCMLTVPDHYQQRLQQLFTGIGMRCVIAPADMDKTSYHAAMVCASNFTCALQYMASNLAHQAGLSEQDARQLLINLSQHSLDSIAIDGPLNALTGPIERGDVDATKQWLSALTGLPEQQANALRSLANVVLDMAKAKQSTSTSQIDAMTELLKPTGKS